MKINHFGDILRRNKFVVGIIGLIVVLAISLSPFYGLAYLCLIVLMSAYANYLPTKFSFFTRSILSLFIFCTLLMTLGVVAWLLHEKIAPYIVVTTTLLFHFVINKWSRLKKTDIQKPILFDRQDLIALILASIAPLIVIFSFYLPDFSATGSIQFITRGYDNIAHLTFLKATADENGYVYGTREDTDDRLIHGGGSYPQGWHFATSHFLNGFNGNLFNTETPTKLLTTYVAVVLFWFIVTVFIFTRFSTHLLSEHGVKLGSIDKIFAYSFVNLLVQFILFWSSLSLGFPNFIACIAYLIFLAAVLHDKHNSTQSKYILSILAVVAVAQIWLMPLPAILLSVALYFSNYLPRNLKSWRNTRARAALFLTTTTVLGLSLAAFQAYVFLAYSDMDTGELLNHDGGIFWISNALFGVIGLFSISYIIRKSDDSQYVRTMLCMVAPTFIMLTAVFAYQILSTEKTTYYFVKLLGIAFGIIGIYFTVAFMHIMSTLNLRKLSIPMPASVITLTIIGTLILSTGQTTLALNHLLQRYSITPLKTAQAVQDYLLSDFHDQRQIVVLRGKSFTEDNVTSYLANRLSFKTGLCVNGVNYIEDPLRDRVNELKKCAESTTDPIVVIASPTSRPDIESLKRSNLIVKIIAD